MFLSLLMAGYHHGLMYSDATPTPFQAPLQQPHQLYPTYQPQSHPHSHPHSISSPSHVQLQPQHHQQYQQYASPAERGSMPPPANAPTPKAAALTQPAYAHQQQQQQQPQPYSRNGGYFPLVVDLIWLAAHDANSYVFRRSGPQAPSTSIFQQHSQPTSTAPPPPSQYNPQMSATSVPPQPNPTQSPSSQPSPQPTATSTTAPTLTGTAAQNRPQNPTAAPKPIPQAPLSPASAQRETQRITSLLELNLVLIQEILYLQSIGRAKEPLQQQPQGQASPTTAEGDSEAKKEGSAGGDVAEKPKQQGSREWGE